MKWLGHILRETPDMPDELINIKLSMIFNMVKEAKVYNIINMSFPLSPKEIDRCYVQHRIDANGGSL